MQKVNRRSAVALGLAAASAAAVRPAIAQTPGATETSPFPGVVVRSYGEERSLIPGFKTVTLRDVILQPGAKTKEETEMMNAMVCHIAEGELRVVQDGPLRPRRTTSGPVTWERRNTSPMTVMPLRLCVSQT
jgi:hypothetical protein